MTKKCKHDWTYKPDYPEDIICEKCQTIFLECDGAGGVIITPGFQS